MSEITDRPWWEDVQHLRPHESGTVADGPKHPPTGRFRRANAPMAETRAVAERREVLVESRRATPDFDFDAGLSSLLDPAPREEQHGHFEWIDLSADDAVVEQPKAKPLDERRAWLTEDDRASGWDLDGWKAPEPAPAARKAAVRRRPPRTPAERLAGRPDRIALYAFLLGLLLIAIAAIGTPKADAATVDAAAAPQAPALVVTVDAAQ